MDGLQGAHMLMVLGQRFLVLPERLPKLALAFIDAPQVEVREAVAFVARRAQGAFKPRDRLVQLALLDQLRADVVVRVAECGVHLDGR